MKHLRSIEEVGKAGVERLLDLADHMAEVNRRPNPRVPALRGKTICNVFFEDSTRTRLSFETAAKRLSAETMTFSVSNSSVNKGESLRDTIETITAMGVDSSPFGWSPLADQRMDARICHQCGGRLALTPDSGSARLLHDSGGSRSI
jgi:hypothetical protein